MNDKNIYPFEIILNLLLSILLFRFDKYKNLKNGNNYWVLFEANGITNVNDSNIKVVVYCNITGIYVRELNEFNKKFIRYKLI